MNGKTKQMRTFFIVWLGQLGSLIGSRLTSFGLGVWVYQKTGSATDYALIALSAMLPQILISPFAGVLADRWNRRYVMIVSDWGAGISTLIIAFLLFTGQLHLWHIYTATLLSAICQTFQQPAYLSAISQLVPKQYLMRANGMIMMANGVSETTAPLMAGFLMVWIKLQGIILIDVVTFLLATTTLLVVRFPTIFSSEKVQNNFFSIIDNLRSAWSYLLERTGLFVLLLYFGLSNLFFGMVTVLFVPLILSFASEATLGILLSIGGLAMVLGSLWVSTRMGEPSSYIKVMFYCDLLISLCIILAGLRPSVILIAIANFLFSFSLPFGGSCLQTLFQKKISPQMQGRVFALKQSLVAVTFPLAYVLAGFLADQVFEPLMNHPTGFTILLGRIIGTGQGRGIGLLFVMLGLLLLLSTFIAYQYPRIRFLEQEIPDVLEN